MRKTLSFRSDDSQGRKYSENVILFEAASQFSKFTVMRCFLKSQVILWKCLNNDAQKILGLLHIGYLNFINFAVYALQLKDCNFFKIKKMNFHSGWYSFRRVDPQPVQTFCTFVNSSRKLPTIQASANALVIGGQRKPIRN